MYRFILLLTSLFILSCSPVRKYQNLPEVKHWEKDIQKFEQLDKSETYSRDAIIFAGSSSIVLWSTLAKDMAPYPVIQRGYGSARLSDFVVYTHRIFDPHPCKAIVIFIANDIIGNDQDKSPQEVKRLFQSVLRIIRKTHHKTPVFWIAITPTASRWKVWTEIQKANDLIKDVCNKHNNTYFIRTDYAFLNDKAQPRDELFRDDKLHLNDRGYAVWTEIIKKELDKILKPSITK